MKDESEGKIIGDFVGLKSKTYSMQNIDDKESNTAKGVNVAAEFNEFKNTLLNKKIIRHKLKRIQSKKHKLGTYEINKISLSCFHDKRFVLTDGIHSLLIYIKAQIHTNDRDSKIFSQKEDVLKDIRQILKDSHKKKRLSQMITNKNKYVQIILERQNDRGTRQQCSK